MANDNVEDLIALARRGELSEAEHRRLEMVLKTSDSARVLSEVGLDFDRLQTHRAGDAELVARVGVALSERAGARAGQRPRRGRRLLLLVAMALATSAAAASVVGFSLSKSQGAAASQPTSAAQHAPPRQRSASPAAAPKAREAREAPSTKGEPESAAESEQRKGDAAEGLPPATPRRKGEELDAKSLFTSANDERKAGRSGRALAAYRRLQHSFPNSPQARLSLVLSGRLLLAQGQPQGALSQFNRYLAGGGQGGLAEEALWGKAQALSRLGRSSEERQVWRTLLDRYPESVYAPAARSRLQR